MLEQLDRLEQMMQEVHQREPVQLDQHQADRADRTIAVVLGSVAALLASVYLLA